MYKLIVMLSLIFLLGCSSVMSASTSMEMQRDMNKAAVPPPGAGFLTDEAKKLLEFCIELNNQDDRAKFPGDGQFKANLDGWRIEYDSRKAGDDNPETNGFGPFDNAWLLLKSNDGSRYAIAIRGTVGQARSIIDDFLATTIAAQSGLEFPKGRHVPIVFAATPKAEVHLGFAYASFSILFDKERGILNYLRSHKILDRADQILITGHSQGAAVATLIHSFLYYAISDTEDRYELGKKPVPLKSYLFAQPKPGNLQYASDFARIAGGQGLAFVINNHLDPVPQVPLSLQTPVDVSVDVVKESRQQGSLVDRALLGTLNRTFKVITDARGVAASKAEAAVAKKYGGEIAQTLDVHYFKADEKPNPIPASSLNYSLAGQLIPVFGLEQGGDLYPPSGDKPDLLLQHHATTYRKLLNRQL